MKKTLRAMGMSIALLVGACVQEKVGVEVGGRFVAEYKIPAECKTVVNFGRSSNNTGSSAYLTCQKADGTHSIWYTGSNGQMYESERFKR